MMAKYSFTKKERQQLIQAYLNQYSDTRKGIPIYLYLPENLQQKTENWTTEQWNKAMNNSNSKIWGEAWINKIIINCPFCCHIHQEDIEIFDNKEIILYKCFSCENEYLINKPENLK